MSDPLAFFLTWHTHGTWLPGDARGTVDRRQNRFDSPLLPPQPQLHAAAQTLCRTPPVTLTSAMRSAIASAVVDRCRFARWNLYACAVRTNHVHVVVGFHAIAPEQMLNSIKSWSTRSLRIQKLLGPEVSPWVRHGSTRYLWDLPSLECAVRYVQEGQDVPR